MTRSPRDSTAPPAAIVSALHQTRPADKSCDARSRVPLLSRDSFSMVELQHAACYAASGRALAASAVVEHVLWNSTLPGGGDPVSPGRRDAVFIVGLLPYPGSTGTRVSPVQARYVKR